MVHLEVEMASSSQLTITQVNFRASPIIRLINRQLIDRKKRERNKSRKRAGRRAIISRIIIAIKIHLRNLTYPKT